MLDHIRPKIKDCLEPFFAKIIKKIKDQWAIFKKRLTIANYREKNTNHSKETKTTSFEILFAAWQSATTSHPPSKTKSKAIKHPAQIK